jgi:hypothetical protein
MGGWLEEGLEAPLGLGWVSLLRGRHIDACLLIGGLVVHGQTFAFRPYIRAFF